MLLFTKLNFKNYSIEIIFRHLGNVRYFFLFIFAWSMVSNNVFNYYSISITTQVFGSKALLLPRYIYTLIACAIMIIMSVVGRDHLYTVLSDLMAIIGYWSIIYWIIFVEEHLIFRSGEGGRGWDLSAWNDKDRLPKGLAAICAFCVGAAGAILGMSEAWYTGIVGRLVGDYGGDLGIEMGFLFALCAYPPLRWMEVKKFNR
jgi:purine-cytosine permease-like protein